MKYANVCNYFGGKFEAFDGPHLDVLSPLDGAVLSRTPLSSTAVLDAAATAADAAFPEWSGRTIKERSQVFYNYRSLLQRDFEHLANLVHEENGKTLDEGRAEVAKAIEITEFACSLPQLTAGEVLEVSAGVECRVQQTPLGIVASVTPFNFPAMVPHWTIPIALCLGNCLILKPSEQTPLTAGHTAQLLEEAGLPAGVFSVIQGDKRIVEAICEHPRIAAISFVGSTPVAKQVYVRAASQLKRVLALGGAKNHLIVLPDADVASAAANIVDSMAGCAGQRCMAAASMLAVGDVQNIIDEICQAARRMIPGKNLGAVISQAAMQRIEGYIGEAEQEGATLLVDGRGARPAGCENGFYVGATVLDHVRPEMKIASEEVFGPVLSIIRVQNQEQALALENASPYGNAAAVYTQNGHTAREIVQRASAGMIGVNVGVPVPREPFGFGGWNDSRFGVGDITGKSSISFWTQSKKITTRWR